MFKKITALLLAVMLLCLCVACGGNDDAQSEVNSTTDSSTVSIVDGESEVKNMLNINVTALNKEKFSSNRPIDPSKEKISLILVTGQSNFTTSVGYSAEYGAYRDGKTTNMPEAPVVPAQGVAYSFGTSSTSFVLDASRDMNTLCRTDRTGVLGGVTPSFAIQWNALTGTKVVFIQAAVGAVGVHEWTPDPSKYACTCVNNGKGQLYANAVSAYTRAVIELSEKYNIVYTGYIWNQGEHDEVYGAKEGVTIRDAKGYYDAYKEMHDGFMNSLNLDFGGISVVRANNAGSTAQGSNSYTIARAAQYKLCNDIDDLYMLSTISETCSHAMMDQGNTIHYSQTVFNVMGAEMADSLFSALKLDEQRAYEGIRIYGFDGSTVAKFDAEGKPTLGNGTITRSDCGGNVIIRPEILGTDHKIDFELSLAEGDGSKYIDEFGAINWNNLYKDLKVNELEVNITVK